MFLISQNLDQTTQPENGYGVFGSMSDMYQKIENSHPDKSRCFYLKKKKGLNKAVTYINPSIYHLNRN